MKTRAAGFTLLEMVVYTLLFTLALTSIYGVFIGTIKNFKTAQANIEVQQGAQAAFNRLAEELGESSAASVRYYTVPTVGTVFESARWPTASNKMQWDTAGATAGSLRWKKYICYYLDATSETSGELALFRKEKEFAVSTTTPLPSADTADTFKNDGTLRRTFIARHFPLTNPAPSFVVALRAGTTTLYDITIATTTNTAGSTNSITVTGSVNVGN